MVVDEDLECPFCKFYAKAPAGLSIHIAKGKNKKTNKL